MMRNRRIVWVTLLVAFGCGKDSAKGEGATQTPPSSTSEKKTNQPSLSEKRTPREQKASPVPKPSAEDVKAAILAYWKGNGRSYFILRKVEMLGSKCSKDGCMVQAKSTFRAKRMAHSWISLPGYFVQVSNRSDGWRKGFTHKQENTLNLIYFEQSKTWRVRPK